MKPAVGLLTLGIVATSASAHAEASSGGRGALAAKFDHGAGPFICGASGTTGPDGLAEANHIRPCYGADGQLTGYYKRVNLEWGLERRIR